MFMRAFPEHLSYRFLFRLPSHLLSNSYPPLRWTINVKRHNLLSIPQATKPAKISKFATDYWPQQKNSFCIFLSLVRRFALHSWTHNGGTETKNHKLHTIDSCTTAAMIRHVNFSVCSCPFELQCLNMHGGGTKVIILLNTHTVPFLPSTTRRAQY